MCSFKQQGSVHDHDCVTQCEILVFFNVNNFICKARYSTSSGTIFRSHQSFHFYYCSESSEGTLYHFYFLCKAVKFHIKQYVCTAYMLLCILLRPLLMQFVVSSAFCHHRCVFMRVSSWWRAVSVHGVYAGGNCDPSLDGVVTQVPEHSLVQSSRLTFPLFYDRQLKEEPSNYLHPKTSGPSFTRFEKPTHV